jgi:hypothetical protein
VTRHADNYAIFMDSDKNNRNCEKPRQDWAAQIYERAQESAFHADVIAYEVAANSAGFVRSPTQS